MSRANPPGERPCPVCGATMTLAKHATVEIDVCEDHGAWLDAGELPRIVSRVRGRERAANRGAVRRAKNSGKVSGFLWGPLAFLLD